MSDVLAEAFAAQRERLRAVARRVLGSDADADDVVQEAWLRLARQDAATIDNLAGWLTTVVGRIVEISVVTDPGKLASIDLPSPA
ncbi:DNA-directed RNA polymerase specialized sigma24 family protein [Nonomuraea soli]|uniref:DNA-directed RNA polymerase specialized sigma24 family protein n=1 Tax=Nonomuraea soli TaxID=1032476 RepID=A0A7W0CIN4_9ACTN|nr:DNA-directed RNA polymerase specialized sigma24 family protein [Nonomuraea soli]